MKFRIKRKKAKRKPEDESKPDEIPFIKEFEEYCGFNRRGRGRKQWDAGGGPENYRA